MTFKHPATGQGIQFLPPGSGLGTLVKIATSEYIRYFNALKEGAKPRAQVQTSPQQQPRLLQQQSSQQPPPPREQTATIVAQQAVARSVAIRTSIDDGDGEA